MKAATIALVSLACSACAAGAGGGSSPSSDAGAWPTPGLGGSGGSGTGGAAGSAGGGAAGGELGGAAGTAGTAGTAGASGELSIEVVAGNHQMVPEMYPAGEPMLVEVRAGGVPAPNVALSWKVSEGWGNLGKLETTTDASGRSENKFVGNYVPPNVSFTRQKITVATGATSAELRMTTCDTGTGSPIMPLAVLEAPEQKHVGSAKAGSTVPGAVKVRVVNQAGPYVGTALPEIGVWLDGPAGIQCKGGVVLTDDKGLATCDLEVGAQPGSHTFSVKIGGAVKFDGVQVDVTP
ncbi:MAG: hypothetical protein IPM35_36220 [Myxococcales bacterium]|nr:hypothetical protein [Myxococcales bacterium]